MTFVTNKKALVKRVLNGFQIRNMIAAYSNGVRSERFTNLILLSFFISQYPL